MTEEEKAAERERQKLYMRKYKENMNEEELASYKSR